jgi:hypothetical protein
VLARFHDPSEDFKLLFEDLLFLASRSQCIFAFVPISELFVQNYRNDDKLTLVRESV